MSNIFVIVLKKYPKDYEHTSAETGSAKVMLIVLNRLFEKEDKTLLFIRKDLESHQARDYQEIANYLTKDHVHDFFEESKRFQFIKSEYWKHNYPEIFDVSPSDSGVVKSIIWRRFAVISSLRSETLSVARPDQILVQKWATLLIKSICILAISMCLF